MNNENLEKIKQLCDVEVPYNEVCSIHANALGEIQEAAERMAAEIEQLKEEVNETQTVYYSVLKDNTRLKAELEKRQKVVFCKDCEKWHTENCSRRHWDDNYIEYFYPEKDGYCEHGQRGESEEGK